jgi:isoleucyl-tRNA synthetase
MAPDHGEDDFELCKAHGIEPVFAVEGDGKYRADWAWLGGQGIGHQPQVQRARWPDLFGPARSGGLLASLRITSIPTRIRGGPRPR